jgi:hypothetical protein
VIRPELVEGHGYDTKYAMHAARLGYQGLELLETGRLTLPMPEPERSRVMAIRRGERTLDEAIEEIDEVERRLEAALERTALPATPDRVAVDRFLVDAYRAAKVIVLDVRRKARLEATRPERQPPRDAA